MRDFVGATYRCCRSTRPRVREAAARSPAIIEACARRGIRAISPWRDQVHAAGLGALARQMQRRTGSSSRAIAAAACFPAADAAGLRAALDDNRRAVDEAQTLGAPCLVLVVGGLPGALPASRRTRTSALARAQVHDGIAATLEYARRRRHAARHRAAASHVRGRPRLHQHAGAGARHLRRARSRPQPARWASRSTSITCGGTRSSRRRSRAPARERLLAYHVCDWLVPTRDLLNDRGMMGDGVIELKKIRALGGGRRATRGHIEVEIFSDAWWSRPADEVLDTCIARYQTVV